MALFIVTLILLVVKQELVDTWCWQNDIQERLLDALVLLVAAQPRHIYKRFMQDNPRACLSNYTTYTYTKQHWRWTGDSWLQCNDACLLETSINIRNAVTHSDSNCQVVTGLLMGWVLLASGVETHKSSGVRQICTSKKAIVFEIGLRLSACKYDLPPARAVSVQSHVVDKSVCQGICILHLFAGVEWERMCPWVQQGYVCVMDVSQQKLGFIQ